MSDKEKDRSSDESKKKIKTKKKWRKPELTKQGILSIVEGD